MLRPYDILDYIISEIENSIRDGVNVDTLVEKFSISRSHIHRIFMAVFNIPAAEYIRSRKLVSSLDDLRKTDANILDIAVTYGFEYEQSYIRSFKSEFGVTPGQFRKTGEIGNIKSASKLSASGNYLNELYLKPEILLNNQLGLLDGYNYSLWKNSGSAAMAVTGNGCFKCKWNRGTFAIFRTGKLYDEKITYDQLGTVKIDFGARYKSKGGVYLGVNGWTVDPLINFYIIEDEIQSRVIYHFGAYKGTVNIDGGTYNIFEKEYFKQISIKGIQNFKTYWSIRDESRKSGIISVSEHLKTWEELGMKLGGMYEIALAVQGWDNSGSAEVYRNVLTDEKMVKNVHS